MRSLGFMFFVVGCALAGAGNMAGPVLVVFGMALMMVAQKKRQS